MTVRQRAEVARSSGGDRGATAVELGLIVALVAIVVLPAILFVQSGVAQAFWNSIGGSGQEPGQTVCLANDPDCSAYAALTPPDIPGYAAVAFQIPYSDIVGSVGVPVAPQTPAVTGGSGVLSFAVSPLLPAGLQLNAATGAISGTPTTTASPVSYRVTVTDQTSQAFSTFLITVGHQVTFTQGYQDILAKRGTAIVPQTPVVQAAPNTPTFSISPTLPAGLLLDAATGTISGTPTSVQPATLYTVTATAGGLAATTTLTISVGSLSFTSGYTNISQKAGTEIAPQTPVVAGSVGTVSFSVVPALPAALAMEPATGKISGKISAKQASKSYTVTATDTGGGTATTTFTIRAN